MTLSENSFIVGPEAHTPEGNYEANLSLGGALHHQASFAAAALEALAEDSKHPMFVSTRNPKNKAPIVQGQMRNVIMPKNIKISADHKYNENFVKSIQDLGQLLSENGVSRINTLLDTIAGAGGSHLRTFLKLTRGSLDTHDLETGELTPDYADFRTAAAHVTGEIFSIVLDELADINGATGAPLIDKDTNGVLIGYNSWGYNDDGTKRVEADPLMNSLYAPIEPGKTRAEEVAIERQKEGYKNWTVYNTVEILTESSQVFPCFEAIVVQRAYTKLWSNDNARHNDFWKPVFTYVENNFPEFEKLGQACDDLLYGPEILDIWNDKTLQYGEKCKLMEKTIREKFEGNLSKITYLSKVFSEHADKAFGGRLSAALASKEFSGEPVVYLGYEELSQAEVSPTQAEKSSSILSERVNFNGFPEERANIGGVFAKNSDGKEVVVWGQGIENEHMGIVPGVYMMRKVLGGEFEAGKLYNVNFDKMLTPNGEIEVAKETIKKKDEADNEVKYSLLEPRSGKSYMNVSTTVQNPGLQVEDEMFFGERTGYLNFDDMRLTGIKKIGTGEFDKKGKEIMATVKDPEKIRDFNPTATVGPEKIRELIPHRGDFLFAESCKTMRLDEPNLDDPDKDKPIFLYEGNIEIDRGEKPTGLECLLDAAAQVTCSVAEIPGSRTIFRNIKKLNFTPDAIERDKNGDLNGKFVVKGYLPTKPSMGSGMGRLRVEDENGVVMFSAYEFGCAFM